MAPKWSVVHLAPADQHGFAGAVDSLDLRLGARESPLLLAASGSYPSSDRQPRDWLESESTDGQAARDVRLTCAPCQGGAFQWVQAPPGNRSSRKQPEQSWR